MTTSALFQHVAAAADRITAKKRFAAVVLSALVVGTSAPAWAYSRDFQIVNQTGVPITAVYMSVPSAPWIRNSDISWLAPDAYADVMFDRNGPCDMQLRVDFSNGYHTEWRDGFNFCAVSRLVIRYNADRDTIEADTD
ncbi:MAG TPA: hypothetical protein VMU81_09555 [Acetobacteraceae bacterium]|jgi:hypothetical protein|nr:hypothetical protein [Acetobacteraceae bacterium]